MHAAHRSSDRDEYRYVWKIASKIFVRAASVPSNPTPSNSSVSIDTAPSPGVAVSSPASDIFSVPARFTNEP